MHKLTKTAKKMPVFKGVSGDSKKVVTVISAFTRNFMCKNIFLKVLAYVILL